MVENNSLITANDPPSTILSDLRVPEDQSPWIVRHNFSYIRSEHPDREGANSYNLDRRGSFAFCAITRPFSNLNANGDRTFDWLKNDLGAESFILGYKVYDENENLIASDNHELKLFGEDKQQEENYGGSLSLIAALALAFIGFLILPSILPFLSLRRFTFQPKEQLRDKKTNKKQY